MNLRVRLSGLVRWAFVEPRALWVAILAPTSALILARLLPITSEFQIRVAGFAITVLGVVLVAKAIFETQDLFKRPTLRKRVVAWLGRLVPLLGPARTITGQGSSTLNLTVSARGHVRATAKDPSSLESRVDAIEDNLKRIDDRITGAERRYDDEVRRLEAQLSEERQVRQQMLDSLDRRLEDYSVGSLDWEIVGVLWVVVGQAFGSFSGEIGAALFS